MRKKAEVTGTNAMLLVLVIAGFILMYILFLPPAEREELLKSNKTATTTKTVGEKGVLLIVETPGTLQPEQQKTFEHKTDSITISTVEEDRVIESVPSVYVSSTRSSEKTKKLILVFENAKNIKNARLSFNIKAHKGRLITLLNDIEIFNGEVESYVEPVKLTLQGENILELKASPVGWRFWETNFYEISELKITATVKDVKNQEAAESFYVSEEEERQIEKAKISYYVDCNKIGSISLYINDELISSGMPDCSSPAVKQIDPRIIITGRNEIRAYTEEGAFLLDNVMVTTELKEALTPTYYFDVNKTYYDRIQEGRAEAVLTMRFADDERKVIDITINGHKTQVDTESESYSRTITKSWIEKGANYITIEPQTTVKISELKLAIKE